MVYYLGLWISENIVLHTILAQYFFMTQFILCPLGHYDQLFQFYIEWHSQDGEQWQLYRIVEDCWR